jgi:hypothetical protein
MAVHRFFCDNDYCPAKTFTERISAFIQHYARRTDRLAVRQQSVAIDAGGAIAQRVLNILEMPVNRELLKAHLMRIKLRIAGICLRISGML